MRMTLEQLDEQSNFDCGGAAIQAWPRNRSERLRPHKGGGGGGGDGGAQAREDARQARIAAATEEINRIFNNQVKKTGTHYVNDAGQVISAEDYNAKKAAYDTEVAAAKKNRNPNPFSMFNMFGEFGFGDDSGSGTGITAEDPSQYQAQNYEYWADGDPANSRSKMYNEQKSAVYDLNKAEVDRQAQVAERTNRFGLARTGLIGGSADVDSNAELNRRTNEGLIRAGGIADQSAADLKLQDEKTRSNLVSMAQSGIDTGTAAQMALNGLSVNADQAAAQRNGATIGSLFGDLSQAYLANQQAGGNALAYANSPYANNQFIGSQNVRSGGASGTVQQ